MRNSISRHALRHQPFCDVEEIFALRGNAVERPDIARHNDPLGGTVTALGCSSECENDHGADNFHADQVGDDGIGNGIRFHDIRNQVHGVSPFWGYNARLIFSDCHLTNSKSVSRGLTHSQNPRLRSQAACKHGLASQPSRHRGHPGPVRAANSRGCAVTRYSPPVASPSLVHQGREREPISIFQSVDPTEN